MSDDPQLTPDQQRQVDAAKVAETVATARKAVAEAADAEHAAAATAMKARIGEVAPGPFAGSVETGDGAALAEMNYCARAQLEAVAQALVDPILAAVGARAVVYLTAKDGPPDLGHDAVLTDRLALVTTSASAAQNASDAVLAPHRPPPHGVEGRFVGLAIGASVTGVGLALSAANSLLGYLRTDFKLGGAAVAVGPRPLLFPVAKRLKAGGKAIVLDSAVPQPRAADRAALQTEWQGLATTIAGLRERITRHTAKLAALDAPPKKPDPAHDHPADPAERAPVEHALAACRTAVDLFDALATALYADAGGVPFIERALQEGALRRVLGASAAIVSLAIDGAWGTHVVEKGLFAGLWGRLPLRVGATVAVSWAATDLATGEYLGSDIETVTSGLVEETRIGAGLLAHAAAPRL